MSHKYEGKIEEILTKVVGNGKVIAKVSVNLTLRSSGTELSTIKRTLLFYQKLLIHRI